MTGVICREIETKIISALVTQALAAGYTVSVDNQEEVVLARATTLEPVIDALFSVDEELLRFYHATLPQGWVRLVHGNGAWDVISDYTCNLEPLMAEADRLSDHYSKDR